MLTEHHIDCPVCGGADVAPVVTVKDYTVTGESFAVWHCRHCTFRFTQDMPAEKEIGRYYQSADYISHSETKQGLINTLYHYVRKITLQGKRKLIEKASGKTKGMLLDIGAGTGSFLNVMKQNGWDVKGLEPDENARQKGKELYNVSLESIEVFYTLPARSFDVITMWHVLEHVHDLHDYIQQLKKLIKPGGKLLIAVPNYTSYDAAHYNEYWAAYDVPRHLWHFSPQSMQQLLQLHGLKIETVHPMWFDSFYVAMLSEKYKNGKGNLLKAYLVGCFSNFKAMLKKDKCSSLIYVVG